MYLKLSLEFMVFLSAREAIREYFYHKWLQKQGGAWMNFWDIVPVTKPVLDGKGGKTLIFIRLQLPFFRKKSDYSHTPGIVVPQNRHFPFTT